jgi:S-adenosylhomocysteine hydrolase
VTAINKWRGKFKNYAVEGKYDITWSQELANCAYRSMALGKPMQMGVTYFTSKGEVWCNIQGPFGTITKGVATYEPLTAEMATAMIDGMVTAEKKRCSNSKCCLKSTTKGEIAHYTQIMWAGSLQVGCGYGSHGLNVGLLSKET